MVLGNYRKVTEYDIDELSATEYSKEYGITIYTDKEMIPWHCEIKSRVGFGRLLRIKDITLRVERIK